MNYQVVYDEAYIRSGYILFSEDYTQFVKIMPNIKEDVKSYTFVISDNKLDNEKEPFRKIELNIDQEELKDTLQRLDGKIFFSNHTILEGYNQMRIKDNTLVFLKDLTFSKNLYCNAMTLTLSGDEIYHLYQAVAHMAKKEIDKNKVLEKMFDLKAA